MRSLLQVWMVLSALLLFAPCASGLRRHDRRIDDSGIDHWRGEGTATVSYYNICTGWSWNLAGFDPSSRFGVVVDAPAPLSVLASSWHYIQTAAPTGWGLTGVLQVSVPDGLGCPTGVPLAEQVFHPVTHWNRYVWDVPVGPRFLVTATIGPGRGNPIVLALDHPASVAGGPPACGTCYPTTRENHTFSFGTGDDDLCPPDPLLVDGACDAQLLWDAAVTHPTALVPDNWAGIKTLYR